MNPEPRTPNPEPSARAALTIYRPNYRHELGWFETWATMARNTWEAREMIWQLWKRDFVAQYKKSFIGIFWRFISPLAGIASWVFLQMSGLLKPGDVGIPYPAYVLMGTTMWSLFTGFLGAGRSTLGAGGGLMQQVNYAHEALLAKQVLSFLGNFMLRFLLCLVVLCVFGVIPSWWTLAFPLFILPLFFLGAAMGLIIELISIVAVDVNRLIAMALGLLMWTTPIIYGNKVPNPYVQEVIKWNPLTYLVCSTRDLIIYGRFYEGKAGAYFICAGVSFLLFLLALRLFYVSEDKIIERIV